jgi:hypothetical protein
MNQQSTFQVGVTYGLILGILLSMTTLVPFLAGVSPLDIEQSGIKGWISVFQLGLVVTMLVLAVLKMKKLNGGFIRFGGAFKIGMTTGAISAIVTALYMVFHTTQLVPDFQEQALEAARISIESTNPDIDEDAVDLALSMAEKFTSPFWMGMLSFFSNIFPALIFSLLIAAFMKKDPPAGWYDTLDQDLQ